MSIFAFLPLLSFLVFVFLGAFIFFKDTKSALNRFYLLFSISMAIYAFVEFGYRQSRTYEEAAVWWQVDFTWPFNFAFWVHFAAVYTEKDHWLKNRFGYWMIYLPTVTFCLLDLFGHHITGPPVLKPWGWSFGVTDSIANSIALIWMNLLAVVCAVWLVRFYLKVTDQRKKRSSLLLAVGSLIMVSSNTSEVVLGALKIQSFPLNMPAFLILCLLVGFSIWKYELFTLTPAKAAESIIATMADSLMLVGLEGNVISVNAATTRMTGYYEKELVGQPVYKVFSEGAPVPLWLNQQPHGKRRVDTFESKDIETEYRTVDGQIIPVSVAGSMLYDDEENLRGFLLIARDMTERKRAADEIARHRDHLEELVAERTSQLSTTNVQLEQEIRERKQAEKEKKGLEEQLHQAQKMEAIGRLAGGVAHDFNNLLFVINGYSANLMLELSQTDPHWEDISEIREAARRATELTKQLLAFSRKQVINPKVIDVNEQIDASQKMLGRLIGEDVEISYVPGEKLGWVKMDATQIDQILANLVVNARDAMPDGGALTITTTNILLNEADCRNRPERREGHFVLLSVKDTGHGMDEETQRKIFEPFFTTKSLGHGTGLGLATVYGIVKQNTGFIEVESTVDVGTEFKIFIPQVDYRTQSEDEDDATSAFKGTETILLVEDNDMVRRLASKQLLGQGYNVIEATNGDQAIHLFEKYEKEIDLLLTDVVMPGKSGKELAEALLSEHPDLKVLYMSGYNQEIIDKHGIMKTDVPLISKPFETRAICEKIRSIFDASSNIPSRPAI